MSNMVEDFRQALGRGELLIQRCEKCGKLMLYPRYRCIECGSDQLGWTKASGKGVLHSHTVVRAVPPSGFEGDLPYALGVVKLEEGVQLLARLHRSEDGDWGGYRCNEPVVFKPAEGAEVERRPVPWFGPAS